jgi:hypothetical protein
MMDQCRNVCPVRQRTSEARESEQKGQEYKFTSGKWHGAPLSNTHQAELFRRRYTVYSQAHAFVLHRCHASLSVAHDWRVRCDAAAFCNLCARFSSESKTLVRLLPNREWCQRIPTLGPLGPRPGHSRRPGLFGLAIPQLASDARRQRCSRSLHREHVVCLSDC